MAKRVPATITPKDIAEELGVTPLQFRIFLRGRQMGVGRGKRYRFTQSKAERLKRAYAREHDLELDTE